MSFPDSFLDELKSRLKPSDVIGRHLRLQRKGREFVALSPFTSEKTPSFTVNDQKGFYHCFSSGKHGDIITFVMEMENLTFHEAVEKLAGEAGLEVPRPSPQAREQERRRATLIDVMELAAAFFEGQLAGPASRQARDYLEQRGLDTQTIAKFRLGYAPDARHALQEHLGKQGIEPRLMIEAGLLIAGEDIPAPYDRFRDRIMFPITDVRGRVIAFGGRALSDRAQAKYLNSPETPLFHKGRVLYNLPSARKAADRAGTVIVAEGYMDVIALTCAGFAHAVAPLGTAMTEEQIRLLWQVVPEPVLCFDGDKAGRAAAYRAADRALPLLRPGYSLRFAWLPTGLDPDDLLRAQGQNAMARVLQSSEPLAELVWQREMHRTDLSTPERRAGLEDRIRAVVRQIGDAGVQEHYRRELRTRLQHFHAEGPGFAAGSQRWAASPPRGVRFAGGARRGAVLRRYVPPPTPSLRTSAMVQGYDTGRPAREALLMVILLNHPALLENHQETVAGIEFSDAKLDKLRSQIIELAGNIGTLDRQSLRDHLEAQGFLPLVESLDARIAERCWHSVGPEASLSDAEGIWGHVLASHRREELEAELEAASHAWAQDPSEENEEYFLAIKAELEALENGKGMRNVWDGEV